MPPESAQLDIRTQVVDPAETTAPMRTAPSASTPPAPLGMACVPAASVPMRLAISTAPVTGLAPLRGPGRTRTPQPAFPEITLCVSTAWSAVTRTPSTPLAAQRRP